MAELNDNVYIIIPTTTFINHNFYPFTNFPNNHNRESKHENLSDSVHNSFNDNVYIASGKIIKKIETKDDIVYEIKLNNIIESNYNTSNIYSTLKDAITEAQKLAINTRITFDIQDIPNINKI